jgi:uncharacterized membrane protein YdjX (TVP38/TMEM64 family)
MRDFLRPLIPMVVILAVPILPFLLFGEAVESAIGRWKANDPSQISVMLTVVLFLASDIFLPIPSSLICTLAGWELGAVAGTLINWLGMSLGAILGFALARRFGLPLARRFSREEDLAQTGAIVGRYGPAVLVLGRGVPVVAEASVLIAGLHALSWRKFLPPVLISNFGLAAAYAVVGRFAQNYVALPIALASSILVPVGLALMFRGWSRRRPGN